MGGRGSSFDRYPDAVGRPNEATEHYVSGEGMWINQYLRGQEGFGELSESEKQYLQDLDRATSGTITNEVLYRSVDASAIFGNISQLSYENLEQAILYGTDVFGKGAYADSIRQNVSRTINSAIGTKITDKGFMSTTTDAGIAENFRDFTGSEKPVVLKIKTRKTTKGVNLSRYDRNVSKEMAQKEVLLGRNQSFTVRGVYGRNGTVYVDVDM